MIREEMINSIRRQLEEIFKINTEENLT